MICLSIMEGMLACHNETHLSMFLSAVLKQTPLCHRQTQPQPELEFVVSTVEKSNLFYSVLTQE